MDHTPESGKPAEHRDQADSEWVLPPESATIEKALGADDPPDCPNLRGCGSYKLV